MIYNSLNESISIFEETYLHECLHFCLTSIVYCISFRINFFHLSSKLAKEEIFFLRIPFHIDTHKDTPLQNLFTLHKMKNLNTFSQKG